MEGNERIESEEQPLSKKQAVISIEKTNEKSLVQEIAHQSFTTFVFYYCHLPFCFTIRQQMLQRIDP